jgi:outer membrane lipoprotein-sorting protein
MNFRTSPLRALALAGAALTVAAAPGQAQTLPTAEQVVARYITAIGGEQAIASQQFRRVQIEMSMPAAGMSMTAEMMQARPNKAVMNIDIPGMGSMRQGYDGQVAWSVNPMQGPKILEGKELADVLRQYDFDANMRFSHMFRSMETVGRAQMNGESCVNVKMVTETGDEVLNCFADDDGLLVGAVVKSSTEAGEMESTITFHDYKEFGGLKMPTRTSMSVMGQQMEMTIKSMSTDPIDASVFELPAEIKALRQ